MVQRKAARFVLNKPYRKLQRDSVTDMLAELKWKTLQERRDQHSLILFYKIVNNLVEIPSNILPPKALRGSHHKYQIPPSNIDVHKHSFVPRTVRLWNKLPVDVAGAPTLDTFKVRLASLNL